MKNENTCLNNFYVRFPFHSYNFYNDILSNVSDMEQEDFIKRIKNEKGELICSASKSLYDSLDDQNQDKDKKFISLLKYLIRSSTRTTPYGLLSGVVRGSFNDFEDFHIGDFKKKVNIDLEWLLKFSKTCEKKAGNKLRLCFNNSIICHEDRIYKIWASCYAEKKGEIDIKNTNAIKRLIKFCPYGVYKSKSEIYEHLMCEYKTNVNSVFIKFINELIESEILISDFRIPTVNIAQTDYLLSKLNFYGLKEEYKNLESICIRLNRYNDIEINSIDSTKLYAELMKEMEKICVCNNYIKYDMYLSEIVKHPNCEKKDIVNFYNFLNKFDNGKYIYSNYYNLFLDKYGYSCVKYLDMIDPIHGIGYPEKDPSEKNSVNYKKVFNLLFKNKKRTVDLSVLEDKLQFGDLELGDAELSFYVQKDGNNYKYLCSPLVGSNMIGKSYGRFSYLFKEGKFMNYEGNIEKVELSFIPDQERIANVLSCESNSNMILELSMFSESEKKYINLQDLYVFPREGKLHFYNSKDNLVMDFISTNMTNPQLFPKVLRTLVFLTEAKYSNPFILFQYINEFYSHIMYRPEICYKNFIISSERWTLGSELFGQVDNYNEFIKEFDILKKDNQINNKVYVGNGDNYLLLNIENDIHKRIMYEMIRKDNIVNLINYKMIDNNYVLYNENSKYLGEFVFQIKSNKKNKNNQMNLPKYDINSALKNTLISFEECIYMKIFSKKSDQDYLLLSYINPFINKVREKNLINNCFYIRYKEDNDHLRLRLLYDKKKNSLLLSEILEFQNKIYSSGIVSSISFYPYEREYLRYGGEKNIKYFEEYFNAETCDILQFLNMKGSLSKEAFFVCSCISTLNNLNISLERSLKILKIFHLNQSDKKDLQKFKKENKELIDELFGRCPNKIINSKLINIQINEEKFKEKINKGDFENFNLENILLSLFHMRFNRLIGINRQYENKLMSYIENILYTEERRNFYENKKQDKQKYNS